MEDMCAYLLEATGQKQNVIDFRQSFLNSRKTYLVGV